MSGIGTGRRALAGSLVCGLMALIWAVPAISEVSTPDAAVEATPAPGDGTSAETDAQKRAAAADKERFEKLENKVDVIAEELSRAITAAAIPEDSALTSFSGLGPAASKVYTRDKGLSIGGYGEIVLKTAVSNQLDSNGNVVPQNDVFDALRAVLYVGYKFNDQWVFNSELEFEHGGDGGGGSVSSEFITIDWLPREEINMRVGLVLIPMGFINEIHEPVFFFGAFRPTVDQVIIPTTWRENGAGIFGELGGRFRYRMYAVNGMEATGFSVAGLRGGRQNGGRALVNNWAFVGRFDLDVVDGLIFGGSVYSGKSGQGQLWCGPTCGNSSGNQSFSTVVPGTPTTLYEVHTEYKRYGVTLRGIFTQAFIGDAAQLNVALGNTQTGMKAVASRMIGWLRGRRLRRDAAHPEGHTDVPRTVLPLRVRQHTGEDARRIRGQPQVRAGHLHGGSPVQADSPDRVQARLPELPARIQPGRHGQPRERLRGICLLTIA